MTLKPKALRKAPTRPAPKMADYVVGELRRQIVNGELFAGSNLPTEGQLVARFGVSRTPIREAIRVLEIEGLVDSRQGARNGASIRSPSTRIAARHTGMVLRRRATTLADVYQARVAIEPFAARLLTQTNDAGIVEQLKALHVCACQVVDEPLAWGRASAAFHQAIVELCGNQTIAVLSAQLEEIVSGQIAVEMAEAGAAPEAADRSKANAAHARFIKLVESGDAGKVEAYWRAHLEAAWKWHTVTETLSVDELLRDRLAPASPEPCKTQPGRASGLQRDPQEI